MDAHGYVQQVGHYQDACDASGVIGSVKSVRQHTDVIGRRSIQHLSGPRMMRATSALTASHEVDAAGDGLGVWFELGVR